MGWVNGEGDDRPAICRSCLQRCLPNVSFLVKGAGGLGL